MLDDEIVILLIPFDFYLSLPVIYPNASISPTFSTCLACGDSHLYESLAFAIIPLIASICESHYHQIQLSIPLKLTSDYYNLIYLFKKEPINT